MHIYRYICINNFLIIMLLDSNPNNDAINKVALFEAMLRDKSFTFFDVEDFELIIEYYLEFDFKKKAKKALEIALNQYPVDLSLILFQVEFLNSANKFKESLKCLTKLSDFFPNNIDVIFGLGKVHSLLNDNSQALSFLNNTYELILLDSSYNEYLQELANEFIQINEYENAVNVLKHILKLNPDDETVMMELGVAFHDSEKFSEAITYFEDTIDKNPYNYIAWFNLATIHNINLDLEDAIFGYEMCLVINEKFTAAHYGKANSFIQLKEYKKAIDSFNESFIYERPHAYAYCSIGECYEKIGDYSKALLFYEKSLEIDDSIPESWLGIGVVRDLNNQPNQAIKFIKKAIELDKENPDYWYLYAEVLTKLNKNIDAELAFKKVIQLDPNNIDAWIDYSNFLFDYTSKSKAIKEVERAIASNNNQIDLKLRLVAMQISTGSINKAKNSLSAMQNLDNNTFKKLLDIYPEVLNVEEMNKFFQPFIDNSN